LHIYLEIKILSGVLYHPLQIKMSIQGDAAKNEGRNRRMLDKVIENNRVTIIGEVVSDFTYSHEVFGEGFYMVDIAVNRLSNSVDIIPLMVSERLVDVTEDYREYLRRQGCPWRRRFLRKGPL